MYKYMTLYINYDYMNGFAIKHHTKVCKYTNMVIYPCYYRPGLKCST